MSPESDGYRDWTSLSKAIKSAAQKAVATGQAEDLNTAITQAWFDRFLSRVFATGDESAWLLKGGTGVLARVPRSRATKDVDLAATGAVDLDEAQAELERVVADDIGDHVQFTLASSRPTGLADNQPGVATRTLVFSCVDSRTGRRIGAVPVDIVVGPAPVGRPETMVPANRLQLPRPVPVHPYRLYPIADQIADKVCATVATNYPGGKASSRVKDLVDLVVIARTQRIDLDELRAAIATKRVLSRLAAFEKFTTPDDWEARYRALATRTLPAGDLTALAAARDLVSQLVEPALTTRAGADPKTWVPGAGWHDSDTAPESTPASAASGIQGTEPVRAHTRAGLPVNSYRRNPRGS